MESGFELHMERPRRFTNVQYRSVLYSVITPPRMSIHGVSLPKISKKGKYERVGCCVGRSAASGDANRAIPASHTQYRYYGGTMLLENRATKLCRA